MTEDCATFDEASFKSLFRGKLATVLYALDSSIMGQPNDKSQACSHCIEVRELAVITPVMMGVFCDVSYLLRSAERQNAYKVKWHVSLMNGVCCVHSVIQPLNCLTSHSLLQMEEVACSAARRALL